MKSPLRYQVAETDCGTTSLLNALSFLFNREEIPGPLVQAINSQTLDRYKGAGGTSREAIERLSKWIVDYANNHDFHIHCTRYEKEEVTNELILDNMKQGTVLFVRTWQECEHYIIVTNIDENFVYIFDPYYIDEKYHYDSDSNVEIIFDRIFEFNRKVTRERFFSQIKENFSLGEINKREIVIIKKTR